MRWRHLLFWLILLPVLLLAAGCHPSQPEKKTKTDVYTVKSQPWKQTLYFSGIVNPLKVEPIISPAEGIIATIETPPGQLVKKDQLLYTINTDLAEKNFQPALATYLKDKKALTDADEKRQSSEFLYKNDIISRQDYDKSIEDYYTAQLTAIQSRQKFQQALRSLNIKERHSALFQTISQLDLSRSDDIKQVLQQVMQMDRFSVYAPTDGLLLLPTSGGNNSNNESKSGNKKIGGNIKKGEVLGNIGTTSGITITIKIDEADINKLHTGQHAIITMLTLPGEQLTGQLTRISMQAASTSGTPKFTATVTVNNLPKKARQKLHFGVNAKVAIQIEGKQALFIPINAINEKDGQTSVKKIESNGKTKIVPVIVGTSLENRIMITSGLTVGDKIIVPTN